MKNKHLIKLCYSLVLLCCISLSAFTQTVQINGIVYESDGNTPALGATIVEKGTTNGTVTNVNGEYSININDPNATLIIQYLGFKSQEINVEGRTIVNVQLEEDAVQLDAVVVTAMGISRKEKSLGYSVSKVDNKELTKSSSGNWMNGLSGKVAGLTFDQAGTGPGGSMRVTIRGDQSLNYANNEVLFVVDGMPITSGTTSTAGGSSYANADAPVDFGNNASDINPEDIETISVLKGPSATALYGSRAANGAIVITTKSGRSNKGIGVFINSTTTFEQAGYFPDFQTEYGNGKDRGLNEFSLWELSEEMAPDGIAQAQHYSRYTFGEKFDENKLRYLYASKNWETGEFTKLPWVYQDNWYTGLFETGVTFNNTITIDGSNGRGTRSRVSFTDVQNNWILPNTGFKKQNISIAFNSKVNERIKLSAKVNYYKKDSDNMPVGGYDETNPMYNLVWGFNVNSIDEWKKEYFEGRFNYANWVAQGENGMGLVFPSSNSYNPYRTLYEQANTLDKDRVFGNVKLSIDILKGLSLDIRSGLDLAGEFRTQRKPFYTPGAIDGYYREQTIKRYELNNDFMLRYMNNNLANGHINISGILGGNNMARHYHHTKITLDHLGEEGVYHTENLPEGVNPNPFNYRSYKVVNSLFGMATLSFDDTYFLDITGRNDWSSTLAKKNWSYFYPSVSASILLNQALNLNEKAPWLDFLKMRLSWANVGNDTKPYSLDQYYYNTAISGGYMIPNTIPDPLIKPENVESWELGLDSRFFKNRVSFDVTLYQSSTTNQIVSVELDQIVGATKMKINAGEIENKGIELATRFVPVRRNNFEWSFTFTWAKNKNKLVSLQDDWDPTVPWQTNMGTTIGKRVYIYSFVGEEMHVIYGRGFQRAPEGAFYLDEEGNQVDCSGMHLVNSDGYPLIDDEPTRRIAKVNPDWRAGMTQFIRYKNLSLSATFSAQMGGAAFSVTNFALSYQGKLKNSLEGRYDGLVHEGVNAITNSDGTVTYTKNNTVTSNIKTYYNAYIWNRNNTEMNTFSTSFLKLKELRLDYSLPAQTLQKLKVFQSLSVGVYATNVFCLTEFPQYDPETGMLDGTNIHRGIETMSFPMTRSYGLNTKFSF